MMSTDDHLQGADRGLYMLKSTVHHEDEARPGAHGFTEVCLRFGRTSSIENALNRHGLDNASRINRDALAVCDPK